MPASKRYSDYDEFAWFYDRHWGAEYHRQARPVVVRLGLEQISSQAQILDLCCGTGRLSAELTGRGYRVTGLDGSAQMLHYARQHAPEAEFLLSDARDFHCESTFHLVVSIFESLNHILILDDLARVFTNVFQALLPGGIFLFDLNGELAFQRFWNSHHAIVDTDNVCICRSRYDSSERLGSVEVTMFRYNSGWIRSDVTLTQRCHPKASVTDLLRQTGFSRPDTFDAVANLGMTEEFGLGRTFFICRKP